MQLLSLGALLLLGVGAKGAGATFSSSFDRRAKELDIRVTSSQFAVRRILKDGWAMAPKGEKFLVVNYTVRNSGAGPEQYGRDSVTFSVTDAGQSTVVGESAARFLDNFSDDLLPGKFLADTVVLEVPNDLDSPKLSMLINGKRSTVDLMPFLQKAQGPYLRDNGKQAFDTISGTRKQVLPVGGWDVSLEETTITKQSPNLYMAAALDEQFLLASVKFRNVLNEEQTIDSGVVSAAIIDDKGKEHIWNQYVLADREGEIVSVPLRGKGVATVRLPFLLPKNAIPKKLRLTDPTSGRTCIVTL